MTDRLITHLRHVDLAVPDHGKQLDFFTATWGLSAVEAPGAERSLPVHVERFAPKPLPAGENAAFEVMLAATGQTVTVVSWESVLDAVNWAGASVASTCRDGTCGTREVLVLSGTPDHRGSVLTPQEHAANEYMMTCVSRSLGPSGPGPVRRGR